MPVFSGVRRMNFMHQSSHIRPVTQLGTVALSNQKQTLSLVVRKQICDYLNISRSTLWRIERQDPTFPKSVSFGIRKKQWVLDEINAWALSNRVDIEAACCASNVH
jgi:predicted DNA-binding transcriptional regulator AlpA